MTESARASSIHEIPDGRWRKRCRTRLALLALGLAGALALCGPLLWRPPILLLWNASKSVPVGLYYVRARAAARRGDLVVAWAPPAARRLAAERHYLPAAVPLVKRIAALAGDRVCAAGHWILINGRRVAARRSADGRGQPLPSWSGCRRLAKGEYFLLGDSPASFDGRYFGISRNRDVAGRAVLLWAKPARPDR